MRLDSKPRSDISRSLPGRQQLVGLRLRRLAFEHIGNPVLSKGERTFDHNINTAAFALTRQGTWGNAPKDLFRGPGTNNWDISMFKTSA